MSSPAQPLRILLIGRNGQVGWELERSLQALGHVFALDRSRCDLASAASVRACIREAKPGLIVNAAAYTAVDQAQSEPALAHAINAQAPGLMAQEAHRLGAALVHYSTDYVFDGAGDAPRREDEPAAPLNVYGQTKLAGEQAIRATGVAYLILRTSWVYSLRGKNFLLTMQRLARQRTRLDVVCDQFGAPTWARRIADTTAQLLSAAQLSAPLPEALHRRGGTFHLAAAGATSWHGFAQAIFAAQPDPLRQLQELHPIPASHYPLPAARPANSRLCGARLAQTWGLSLPPWEVDLRLCLAESRP